MDLCNINDIKALLARHGFRFSKSMGQNFLIEGWVPRDIAEASGAAPGCFLPAPKVTSSVLRMVPKAPPAEVDDEAHFFRVVRAAFAQRRKTLANSLSASLGGSCGKQAVARAIEACGLPAAVRGERLSISEFAALSRALRREEAASTSE